MNRHIEKAIAVVGTQSELARLAGVSQTAVNKWLHGGRLSAESALAVERATSGKVTRHRLRPDIFGPRPQDAA